MAVMTSIPAIRFNENLSNANGNKHKQKHVILRYCLGNFPIQCCIRGYRYVWQCLHSHPVDILLLLAASEGDKPIIEELLRAGAKYDVKDADGRTTLDRATEEIKDFTLNFSVQRA